MAVSCRLLLRSNEPGVPGKPSNVVLGAAAARFVQKVLLADDELVYIDSRGSSYMYIESRSHDGLPLLLREMKL